MTFRYVDDPNSSSSLSARLEGQSWLALDCEAAGFHRYSDRLCLVQLSTPDATYLIDPLGFDPQHLLRPLLEDPDVEIIMHGADYDLRLLDRDLGIRVTGLFDTQIAAALLGEDSLGLSSLLERFCSVRLSKKYQRADWAKRPLPREMLEYAASDTQHLSKLADLLRARLVEAGRLEWAREEFRRLEEVRWEGDNEDDPVVRVKKARELEPRVLERLRAALIWRDEIARSRDRAPFRVASDQVLIAISDQPPATIDELAGRPGFSPALAHSAGRDLLERIRRVDALPDADLSRYPRRSRPGPGRPSPEEEERAETLRGARNRMAGVLGLDRGLLLPNTVLMQIARSNPASRDALTHVDGVRRWQVEALGDTILKSLRKAG